MYPLVYTLLDGRAVSRTLLAQMTLPSRFHWQWVPILLLLVFSSAKVAAEDRHRHLFILSGQSNMTGGLESGFRHAVESHYGSENTTVVHHCKPGRGIRFWDVKYRFPQGYRIPGTGQPPSDRSKNQHGQVYASLIQKVRQACKEKSHDTVTLIWMQGESDGMRGLAAVYGESFLRLLERLKTDLKREDLFFVIGRINNAPMNGAAAKKQWQQMREVQVKLAEKARHGTWIDTDDFHEPDYGIHFPRNRYPDLGARFAARAIGQIQKNTLSAENDFRGDDPSK